MAQGYRAPPGPPPGSGSVHPMAALRTRVTCTFRFEAAHRLAWHPGRCRNLHGHSYRLDVSVEGPLDANGVVLDFDELDAVVRREVIDRFDHRHLNVDCPEFAGLNPSVENIARVCHGLLAAPCAAAGAELDHVTVWETEKTSATYPVR